MFSWLICLMPNFFLNPWLWPEGSYEVGSVCLSFHPSFSLSISFLRRGSLVFLKLSMVLGAHIKLCVTEWEFFEKIPIRQKWPKMVKNGPKNSVWGLFKKIKSLFLSAIGLKWKFLWSINILWKLHVREKSVSQVMAKNGCRPIRFEYLLIVNISLIDWSLALIFGM